jgi:hypothetical protein
MKWKSKILRSLDLPRIVLIVLTLLAVSMLLFWPRIPAEAPDIIPSPTPTEDATPSPTPVPTLTPVPVQTLSPTPVPSPVATVLPTAPPPPPPPTTGAEGFSTVSVITEKGTFTASVLYIDLNTARMITDTGNDDNCGSGCSVFPLATYVSRNNGFAGVNGTYFCPDEPAYSFCGGGNTYDFPVWNTRLSKWINAGNLGWNGRAMFYFDGGGAHYLQNANNFGGGLTAGVVNFPGLVDNGNVQIDDNQSGLSANQQAVGTKVGIGLIDSKHIMVVVGRNVNMNQFAYVFKALGAKGALNLDTGGSTALYYNGYKFGPGRNLPNAIVFAR